VVGVDLGTGGARVIVASADGEIVANAEAAIPPQVRGDGVRHEQDPESWWAATRRALSLALDQLNAASIASSRLCAICIDGTSGTVVGVNARGTATTPALMYNDARAGDEALELNRLAGEGGGSGRARIASSFAIAKILWITRHLPGEFARTHCFAHQADFIAGRLCGRTGQTDSGNALKTGYDLQRDEWPAWIDGLDEVRSRLPEVIAPGSQFGALTDALSEDLGLPERLPVIAGVTDGTAGFLASGATRVGEDNTTLGTTLVFKRLANRPALDPGSGIYSHALPGGFWLPGAASNVGGDWIRKDFGNQEPRELDRMAAAQLPSEAIAYPLRTGGERFPFLCPEATGFCEPEVATGAASFAANLQGTAFVERLGYEVLDRASGQHPANGADLFSTGGGSRSDLWMQLRADVLGRVLHRPACHESALGSAILAASATVHGDLSQACRQMVRIDRTFRPDPERCEVYEGLYQRFLHALRQREYLTGNAT